MGKREKRKQREDRGKNMGGKPTEKKLWRNERRGKRINEQ